jgi:hypothetical protein
MPVGKGRKLIDPKEGVLSPAPALTKTGCAVSKYAVKLRIGHQTDLPSKLLTPKIAQVHVPAFAVIRGPYFGRPIDVNQSFAKALPIAGQLGNQLLTTTQFWKIRVRQWGEQRGTIWKI